MQEEQKYGQFKPKVKRHNDLADDILDILDETDDDWMTTSDLVDELLSRGWDKHYSPKSLRNLTTYARYYLQDEEEIEARSERRGGNPTKLWKRA